jgi:membrane protease YdiL (CAAX protease family)
LFLGFALATLIQESALLEAAVKMVREPDEVAASLVVIGLLSPLAEEVVFRGLLYAWFDGRWGPRVAVIGSATLFALGHQEPAYIAFSLPLGLFLGWLRARSRSLFPSLIAHATENSAFVLFARYFGV